MMNAIVQVLARELGRTEKAIENVISLLDEGNTIPFIARYRKEMHGAMDDTSLRTLEERLKYLRNLSERKEEVRRLVDAQGKLTEELDGKIEQAVTLSEVEDLYRPYKPKRRTRATQAKEKGLEPLAQTILEQRKDMPDVDVLAADYIDPEKGVSTAADALAGASDIVAEMVSDSAEIRKDLRAAVHKKGEMVTEAAKDEDSVYSMYYAFDQPVSKLQGHQILAINRGEKEGYLKAGIRMDRETALALIRRRLIRKGSKAEAFLQEASADGYDRLLSASLENEIRASLTEEAAEGAIRNFALNLKPLLMQPPVKGKVTMGLDPGYRMGCKVAVVDATGKVLDTAVVYPTYGERQKKEAIEKLAKMIRKHSVEHIAIGNGTASRET